MKGNRIQEVEKRYGLDKFAKTEYIKVITKEFDKVDKKLGKIVKIEAMKKEELDKDQLDLLSRKTQNIERIEALKLALDIYKKAFGKGGEGAAAVPAVITAESPKDTKVNEFISVAAKKLGYLFMASSILMDKERTSTNPLAILSAGQQAELLKIYNAITHLSEEKDTKLAEEAHNSADILLHFIRKEAATGLEIENASTTIDHIIGDSSVNETMFRIHVPKAQPLKDYGTTQTISVGKDVPVEVPKKEVQPVHEPIVKKEEPVKSKEIEPVVTKHVEEEKKESWANQDEEEEEYEEVYVPAEPKKVEEAEFEVATSKSEERKKRLEEGVHRRGRGGMGLGLRRGGRRGGFGQGRGEFRGQGRGEFRGERRGGRRGSPRGQRGESGPQQQASQ